MGRYADVIEKAEAKWTNRQPKREFLVITLAACSRSGTGTGVGNVGPGGGAPGRPPFRHLPVLDDEGNVAGMITEGDFAAYTFSEAIHRTAETTKEAVTAWYQPFLILLAIAVYTLVIIMMVRYWI